MSKKSSHPSTYIFLKWLDSMETEGWVTPDHVLQKREVETITSVGLLLRRPSRDYPFYAICRDSGPHGVCGVMEIPKVSVLSKEEYEVPWD